MSTDARPARPEYVGSGDIAAIIGLLDTPDTPPNQARNAGDVWFQKTGQLPEKETTSPMKRGLAMEPYVLDLFEAEHGVKLARDVFVRGDDVCAATLDGAMMDYFPVEPDGEPEGKIVADVEAKTTNLGADWDQETGSIPLVTVVQTNFQMYCAGPQCTHAFVPALIPEFRRFKFLSPVPIVKRNEELIAQLVIEAHGFMDYVRRGVRPPDAPPHLETLKRIRREPDSVIALGDEAAELWGRFEAAKDKAKGAERDVEEYKRQVLDLLGQQQDDDVGRSIWVGVEAGSLPDGRQVRFMEQSGGRHCDIDRLQILSPDLYEQLVSQPRFRVLRLKKALAGRKR